MNRKATATEFAPAERSPDSEIKKQTELISSLPHLQQFLDYVPITTLVINKNRQIVFVNKAAIAIVKPKDVASVYGRRPGEVLDCIHASENEGGCGTTKFCRTCGAIKAILCSLHGQEDIQECSITEKESGDTVDWRAWTSPFAFDGERFVFYALVDISDEKRRGVLERIFFHDIMNVIGGIYGYAQLLEESNLDEAREFGEIIYELCNRLIGEIQAYRELIAAENNDLEVHLDSIDAIALLQEILDLYKKHKVAKERDIRIDSNAQQIVFTSDMTLLGRVLGNMVKNALEASSPGDTVKLGVEKIGEEVQFWVHNSGFIPRNVQLQIFRRSFSTKDTSRGLGTYSMRLLSERYLKGSVSFKTSEKDGTIFMARCPLTLN